MAPRLTLICPTFNRHQYLERSFRYWGNCDVNVVYADGSEIACNSRLLQASNILYLHHPVDILKRCLVLMAEVKTPYVCFMCDDEFYLRSPLQSSLQYLEEHPDYVACTGRAIGFYRINNTLMFQRHYPGLRDREYSQEDSFNRLVAHFSNYTSPHFYSVIRTEVLRPIIETIVDVKLDLYPLSELIVEFMIVAAGKTKVLPNLQWLRSHEAPPIRNTGDVSLDTSKMFKTWWRSPKINNQKSSFCSYLSAATKGTVSEVEVKEVFDLYSAGPDKNFMRLLKSPPESIKGPIRSLVHRAKKLQRESGDLSFKSNAALNELRDQGVYIDEANLDECVALIKESWRV